MRDEGLLEEEDAVELINPSSVRQREHTVVCPTGDIVATLSLSLSLSLSHSFVASKGREAQGEGIKWCNLRTK
jgi:hypothetical protein